MPAPFSALPSSVPPGPPRNVALLYRELGQAINEGRPAEPGFDTAVRYHQLVDATQRASDTGTRQQLG